MPLSYEERELLRDKKAFADADTRYAKMRVKRTHNTKKEATPKVEPVIKKKLATRRKMSVVTHNTKKEPTPKVEPVIKKKRATRRKMSAVTHETYAQIFIRLAELLDESEIQRLFG